MLLFLNSSQKDLFIICFFRSFRSKILPFSGIEHIYRSKIQVWLNSRENSCSSNANSSELFLTFFR